MSASKKTSAPENRGPEPDAKAPKQDWLSRIALFREDHEKYAYLFAETHEQRLRSFDALPKADRDRLVAANVSWLLDHVIQAARSDDNIDDDEEREKLLTYPLYNLQRHHGFRTAVRPDWIPEGKFGCIMAICTDERYHPVQPEDRLTMRDLADYAAHFDRLTIAEWRAASLKTVFLAVGILAYVFAIGPVRMQVVLKTLLYNPMLEIPFSLALTPIFLPEGVRAIKDCDQKVDIGDGFYAQAIQDWTPEGGGGDNDADDDEEEEEEEDDDDADDEDDDDDVEEVDKDELNDLMADASAVPSASSRRREKEN